MKKEWFLVSLLVTTSFLIRVFRLNVPESYMFDEVYHAFTAQAYARNDPRGYEWWHKAPEGFAYEWLHPPLAKLIQAGSIKILGDSAFAWRLPGVIFASATVLLLYLFGRSLFNSSFAGFAAAFLYAFDGLSFVQSRITMNDIYVTFFLVLAFYLFWKYANQREYGRESARILVLTGVALGLAASTKWTGFYAIPILGGLFLLHCFKTLKQKPVKSLILPSIREVTKFLIVFLLIPLAIYFLSYFQFWFQGHTWQQFKELHNQIWWYQTNLKATHPYQSVAWTWPFLYRPVWYYVKYGGGMIANIYAMGNPVIWWGGIVAIVASIWYLVVSMIKRSHQLPATSYQLFLVLFGYFGFFLPWAFSPRIMFLYHYLPSIPFMCLALGYGLEKLWRNSRLKLFAICYLLFAILIFIYFYPHLSALPVPKWLNESYFWFKSWR